MRAAKEAAALLQPEMSNATRRLQEPVGWRSNYAQELWQGRGGGVPYDILGALDVIGTAVFAFSGTIAAGRANMDLLGCVTVVRCRRAFYPAVFASTPRNPERTETWAD